ncbi:hypothetical protein FA15DRAFT_756974 [Coprinopsis marcescibilis]|uniref:Uncharacterized protein n=1 Tax=Coprinopsis marcescibilis TaxID=230819 RepID=A0A5C3KTT1_COPMA|nr:hypothetical protein FA15DRAFT_756974 [Coprinopsis marcescibilis]
MSVQPTFAPDDYQRGPWELSSTARLEPVQEDLLTYPTHVTEEIPSGAVSVAGSSNSGEADQGLQATTEPQVEQPRKRRASMSSNQRENAVAGPSKKKRKGNEKKSKTIGIRGFELFWGDFWEKEVKLLPGDKDEFREIAMEHYIDQELKHQANRKQGREQMTDCCWLEADGVKKCGLKVPIKDLHYHITNYHNTPIKKGVTSYIGWVLPDQREPIGNTPTASVIRLIENKILGSDRSDVKKIKWQKKLREELVVIFREET